MKLFWKINIYMSVIVFSLFILNFIAMYFEVYIPNFFLGISGLTFIFSPFLEIIQVPLCLIVILTTLKNQNKIVWMYLLMMIVFFIIKITIYILLLGSIIPLNNQ
ncbi:hypothetical protein CXF68_19005 [Tenacibaculum sp. Bg11-29]|nr:hypothetical protein CXF68_19005 [Tenacibaculum sp. Bg11-29]